MKFGGFLTSFTWKVFFRPNLDRRFISCYDPFIARGSVRVTNAPKKHARISSAVREGKNSELDSESTKRLLSLLLQYDSYALCPS